MTRYHKAGRLFRLLGWLYLALAVLFILLMVLTITASRTQPTGGNEGLSTAVFVILGLIILAFSVLYLKVGTAIKQHKQWARTAGLILGCLVLLNFPIGTVIGGFALYYLIAGWDDVAAVS